MADRYGVDVWLMSGERLFTRAVSNVPQLFYNDNNKKNNNYNVSQKNCANLFLAPCLSNTNRFQ